MIFLFSNFGEAVLEERLPSGGTSLRIAPSDAARFPQPGSGERFSAILYDGVQAPEVVWGVSNPLTGTITVERAKENSAAKQWLPGTAFVHTLTTASIEYFVTSGQQEWIDQLIAEDAAIRAEIAAETEARQALALTVNSNFGTLTQRADDNAAAVQLVGVAVADQQEANAAYQLALNARMDNAEGLIEENYLAFTTFEQSQLTYNQSMLTRVGDAEAELLSQAQAFSDYETATASTLAQLQADLDDASAQITAESLARATQYDAIAGANATLSASLGDVSASLTTTQLAFADLEGNVNTKYGVSLDANGVFAGFSVMAGTGPAGETVSQFKMAVADFIISTPDGDLTPFAFDAINGIAYLQNIVVDGALIENLVVNWADIVGVSIDGADIADASITQAKIANAAIGTAQIADLSVETIKIKDFAVTDPLTILSAGSISLDVATEVELQSLMRTVGAGERVDILLSFSCFLRGAGAIGSSTQNTTLKLYRDSTVIYSTVVMATVGGIPMYNVVTIPWSDSPGAGTFTYKYTVQHASAGAVDDGEATMRYLSLTRVKK